MSQYTHGHHESVLRSHKWRSVENSAAYLIERLVPGSNMLDVGCGPGTITIDFAKRLNPGLVIGIDVDDGVLVDARTQAETERVRNVSFEVGDIYALFADDASFDIVHAHQVLQHLTDPVRALREMRRVCRPGGTVAARDSDYAAMTWFPVDPRLDRWLELYEQLARANGAEPDAARRMLHWANSAGFSEVQVSASTWCYATPALRAWWGGLWAVRVTESRFAEQALESGLSSIEELEDLADAWRTWAGADDGFFSILNAEVLCRP